MDTISLLKELIRIDSSTIEKANEIIEFASAYLLKNGLEGEIIENNGFKSYVSIIGSGEETIVLNGHLDVVSGKEGQFTPIEKNERIYGRGSADMKGGCAAMMNAVLALKDKPLNCKVMLQLVSDEEEGGLNCSRYLVEKGYIGDFAICTEPTNLNLAIQSKGFIRINIKANGASAHGSRPWEGDNAILKNIENYKKVLNLPILKLGSKFFEKSSVNLAFIEGGDAYNRVPDKSTIGLDIRFIPSLNPYEIIEEIKEVVDGEVSLKLLGSGVNTASEDIYVKRFLETINRANGCSNTKLMAQHGSADTRFFSEKGISTLEFGPVGANWHGEDEYVDIKSVRTLENAIKIFIENFS